LIDTIVAFIDHRIILIISMIFINVLHFKKVMNS